MEREEIVKLIAILEEQRSRLGDTTFDAAIQALHEKLTALDKASKPGEQRKQIVIFLADVANFTAMSEQLDAEDVTNLMNDLWTLTDQIIIKYGGKVDKHMGDAVMAVWGITQARENDAEQAVRAALEIQRRLTEPVTAASTGNLIQTNTWKAKLRIGIHTGIALLGEVGSNHEFTAIGDAVNTAARLEEAASPGEVLISYGTFQLVKGAFDITEVPNTTGNEKDKAPRAYRVERLRPHSFWIDRRGVEGVQTRMVGRNEELQQMKDAFHQAATPCTDMVWVVGDAGLGKSRLVHEFEIWLGKQPGQLSTLRARADESRQGLPFGLLREIFTNYFEITEGDHQPHIQQTLESGFTHLFGLAGLEKAHFIGHLLGFDFSSSPHLAGILHDVQQIHNRAFFYTIQWLEALCASGPLVLLLEDLHWADAATLEWLTYTLDRITSLPYLIVGTTRPSLFEAQPAWLKTGVHVVLHPLNDDDSRSLAIDILQQVVNLPEELVQRVISNADGNPFYLEEFIKVLIESGAVIKDENNWHIDSALIENIQIPTTLTGILQARLEHLTTDMENVLQRSAVVGRTFWDGAVASLASPSTQVKEPINITQASLQELQRRGLIFQSEVSIFSDAGEFLFKHALLHDVAYARVLKKTRQEYHHRAAEWLIAASGQRADENAGLIAGHFERAMEKSQAAEWYGRAGDAALRAYVPQAAVDYYRKALELAGGELPSKWRIAILTGLGDSLAHRAHFNEAVEIYLEILDLARIMGNGHGLAQAAVGLERTYVNLGRYEESLQIVEEVEAVIRADSTVTQNELVALLFRKGVSLYYLNHLDRALDVAFEILKISETINALENEAESYSLMGAIYYSRGQHSLSKDYTNRGLQVMRMLGNRVAEANILSNQGDNYRQEGDFQQAKEYFEQSLLIARQIGSVHVEIWCLVNMGYVLADLSCFEESETVLRKALEMTPQEGRYSEQYIYLAQALLGQDKLDQATETALAGFNLSLQENRPYTLGLSWRILAQVISARGTSVSVNVHQSQPETIEPVNSEDCFSRSRDIFAEGGMQSDLAQTYWLWSLHENKSGNSSRASELLNAAREIFQTLDLPLWLKRI